jgi:hypothetical protein
VLSLATGLFGIGTILDFAVKKYHEELWLFMRVTLWDRLESIRPVDLYRRFATAILALVARSKKHEEIVGSSYLAATCIWSLLIASLPLPVDETSEILFPIRLSSAFIAIYLVVFIIWLSVLSMKGWPKWIDGRLSELATSESKVARTAAVFLEKLATITIRGSLWLIFGIGIAWLIFVFVAPVKGLITTNWAIMMNLVADLTSFGITIRLLRYGSTRNPLIVILCALADMAIAAACWLLSIIMMIFVFRYSLDTLPLPQSTLMVYMQAMAITAFVPTVLLAIVMISLVALKFIQALILSVIRYYVDLAADPNLATEAKPFTVLGAFAALTVLMSGFVQYFVR